jgi:hypothetical protein
MNHTAFQELLASLRQAGSIRRGTRRPARTTTFKPTDVTSTQIVRHVELAPQNRLDAVAHLAPRFFREVVGLDYADVLVTDDSDLRDFADTTGDRSAEVRVMLDRLERHYRVDGRVAGSTRIVALLEFLDASGITV